MRSQSSWILVLAVSLLLGGCFEESNGENHFGSGNGAGSNSGGGGGGSGSGGGGGGGSGGGSGTQNQAPTISGTPPFNVLEGQSYEFTPSATDPDGDALEFSVARKPAWARFDRSTGRLWGTPDAGDVGNFTNIAVSVSDGRNMASLTAFDISVNAIAAGFATLSWQPPTENADGSSLTDLAGYKIYYGRNRDNLTRIVILENPGLTRYVIENLTPARWYFQMTSVNGDGVESRRTETASKTIS